MSASSSPNDAFARVSAALLVVWPSVAAPESGLSRAEFGRLLDECGSDHRPLAELLLDLGRSVRPILSVMPPQSSSTWVHARAPLVHRLVSTRYLQPDVARWAVDVWGRALGVAPAAAASPVVAFADREGEKAVPSDVSHADMARTGAAAGVRTRHTPTATRAGTPPVLAPQQVTPAMKQRPSWAGGPVSFGVGQKPSAAQLAALAQSGRVIVRGSVPAGPLYQPVERRAAVVLGILLVVIAGSLWRALQQRPALEPTAPAAPASAAPATTAPAPTAPTAPTAPAPAGPATAAATPVPEHEWVPRTQVSIASERTVRDVGVGGAYLVAQRVRDVSGSPSCEAVAGALAGGRESREIVAHTPGAPTFALTTRGVAGTLDVDGQFVSELRTGSTNNVTWQFRMRGRFGPDGFIGESVTYTEAILRWGKIQTCVVTADLTGRRLP